MSQRAALSRLDRVTRELASIADELAAPCKPSGARDVLAIPFFYVADATRKAVTRKVFRHYANIAEKFDLAVVGVGSEGLLSRKLWCEFFPEVNYHEYPQIWTVSPGGAGSDGLRAKFDETVRAARVFDPERVFIGGSDDLITAGFFERAFTSNADLIGVGNGPDGGVRIVRLRRREVYDWDGSYRWAPDLEFCGGGLVLSRALLEEWEWAPFSDPGDEVGIERRARAQDARCEAFYPRRDDFCFWAVKTEQAVLNGWKQVARMKPHRAPREAFAEFDELWSTL